MPTNLITATSESVLFLQDLSVTNVLTSAVNEGVLFAANRALTPVRTSTIQQNVLISIAQAAAPPEPPVLLSDFVTDAEWNSLFDFLASLINAKMDVEAMQGALVSTFNNKRVVNLKPGINPTDAITVGQAKAIVGAM